MNPWVQGGTMGALLAALLFRWKSVTLPGACAGAFLALWFWGRGGPAVFLGFALFAGGASVLARLGGEGRRSHEPRTASQALANCGVAAAALLTGAGPDHAAVALAALGAAMSDTASTEAGRLSGARPRLLLAGPPVEPGSNGGMSLPGLGAGVLAAAAMGAVAALAAGFDGRALVVAGAGLCGNLVDSILGAAVEDRFFGRLPGWLRNDLVNLCCTASAALLAFLAIDA